MPDQVIELAEHGKAPAVQCRSLLVEAAWEVEIERRLAEYDRGEVQGIDAEIFAKARKIAVKGVASTPKISRTWLFVSRMTPPLPRTL